jgi:hypothetical protein
VTRRGANGAESLDFAGQKNPVSMAVENQGEERIKSDKMIGMYLFTYRRCGIQYEFGSKHFRTSGLAIIPTEQP